MGDRRLVLPLRQVLVIGEMRVAGVAVGRAGAAASPLRATFASAPKTTTFTATVNCLTYRR